MTLTDEQLWLNICKLHINTAASILVTTLKTTNADSVQVFFTMVPFISRLIHQPKFMPRLQLPPRHANFPHPALLHAICAVSARYSAAVRVSSVVEAIARIDAEQNGVIRYGGTGYVEDEIAAISCFAERNFRYAQMQAQPEGMLGRKLFEVSQAQVSLILCSTTELCRMSRQDRAEETRSSQCTIVSNTQSKLSRMLIQYRHHHQLTCKMDHRLQSRRNSHPQCHASQPLARSLYR